MQIFQGYLRTLVALSEEIGCQHEEQFHTVDGQVLYLRPRKNTPRNELIEVHVVDGEIVHFNILMSSRLDLTRKDVALIRIIPEGAEITPSIVERTKRAAQRLESEFRRWGRGWEVSVTPYVLNNYTGAQNVTSANWAWLRRQVDSRHNYLHGWGGTLAGVCGHAYMNHTLAWTFANCSESTMIHEQGHNFGLHHSGIPGAEYGESTWMGSGTGRSGFNLPHQSLLGWVDSESIYWLDANSAAVVYLIDPHSDPIARQPGQFKGIHIIKGYNRPYLVSVFNGSVRLHSSPNSRNFSTTTMEVQLTSSGRTRFDGDEVLPYMELLEERDGVFAVLVKWTPETPTPVMPEWPEWEWPQNRRTLTSEHSGLYYQPDIPGQGFDVWFRENDTVLYWYTYDTKGDPLWLFAKGDGPESGVRHCVLYQASHNGVEEVGKMSMYQLREHEMRLHYYMGDYRGAMDLSMLARKGPGSRLAAFDTQPYSGVSTTVVDDRTVGYVYDFLVERTVLGVRRKMRWRLMDGSSLLLPSGGKFRVTSEYDLAFDSDFELNRDTITIDNQVVPITDLWES